MAIRLLTVPYDCGRRDARMGAGPGHLLAGGLVETLEAAGHRCEVRPIEADTSRVCSDVTIAFDLLRLLAEEVATAVAEGSFPLVLSGPCYSEVGVIAGLGADRSCVLWLDAHGEFNTPDTTTSGFLDGMGATILTGRSWSALAATVPGHVPLPDDRLVLVGVRDLDAREAELLDRSGVAVVSPSTYRRDPAAVHRLLRRPERLSLHFDPDALDRAEGIGNDLASPGGLHAEEILTIARRVAPRLSALTIASYDPACDLDGRVRDLVGRLVEAALPGN